MCGLRKYDHVASSRHTLGWLSLDYLMKHRAVNLMFRHYANSDCVVLDPPLEFGSNHSYDTRTPFYFVKSLVVRLVLNDAFLDRELLIGGIIHHPHC